MPTIVGYSGTFFPVNGVIDANSLFFTLLDNSDKTNFGILDEVVAKHLSGFLEGFITLATNYAF